MPSNPQKETTEPCTSGFIAPSTGRTVILNPSSLALPAEMRSVPSPDRAGRKPNHQLQDLERQSRIGMSDLAS